MFRKLSSPALTFYTSKMPPMISFASESTSYILFLSLMVMLDGIVEDKAMNAITVISKKNNPSYPFDYIFVNDEFNRVFKTENMIGKVSRIFALLAIVISCLGLFGLAAYTAERCTKEIGIRKVLGASVTGITRLLTKDFLQLVIISCLAAFPVAWWIMHNWLQNYKYRIEISWWIFLTA